MPFEIATVALKFFGNALRKPNPLSPPGGPATSAAKTCEVVAGLATEMFVATTRLALM